MMEPTKSPSIATLRLDSFHPELMEQAVAGGMMDHTQLAKGRFVASLLSADLGASRLDWGAYNLPVLAIGEMPADRVTLGCILRSDEAGRLNGAKVQDATPLVLGEQAALNYQLAPATQWSAFQIDRGVLEKVGICVPTRYAWRPAANSEAARELQQGLHRMLPMLHQIERKHADVLDPEALARSLQAGILALFCRALASNSPASSLPNIHRDRRMGLVRRARDLMESRIAEPVRIEALCAATGASWKILERAFFEVYSLSPRRYLTLRRLSLARRRLLAGSPATDSVTGIATTCGIYHAGRFSAAYRELFGETPSVTLASRPVTLRNLSRHRDNRIFRL